MDAKPKPHILRTGILLAVVLAAVLCGVVWSGVGAGYAAPAHVTIYTVYHDDGFEYLTNDNATYRTDADEVAYCMDRTAKTPDAQGTLYSQVFAGTAETDYIIAKGYPATCRISGIDWTEYEARAITQIASWYSTRPDLDIQAYEANNGLRVTPDYIIEAGRVFSNEAKAYQGGDPSIDGASAVYHADDPKMQRMLTETPGGKVEIRKSSSNPSITDGNACYSLEGAVYGVYKDEACTQKIGEITLAEDGTGSLEVRRTGLLYIKELFAPEGFSLDDEVYTVQVGIMETVSIEVGDDPINDPAPILVQKLDGESWKTPQDPR